MVLQLKNSLFLIVFIGCIGGVFGQNKQPLVYASFGFSKTPLQVQRTNETRWMTFPTFNIGYRINQKLIIQGSFMGHDVSLKNYSKEELQKYKEIPPLTSYETAKMYEGKKFTLSLFHDYIFAGIQYEHVATKVLTISTVLDIGYRFGETMLLTNIVENQLWPNGFEVHATNLSSNSPGIKFGVSPMFSFFNFLTIQLSAGNYLFFKWPVIQPYGNAQIGISI